MIETSLQNIVSDNLLQILSYDSEYTSLNFSSDFPAFSQQYTGIFCFFFMLLRKRRTMQSVCIVCARVGEGLSSGVGCGGGGGGGGGGRGGGGEEFRGGRGRVE